MIDLSKYSKEERKVLFKTLVKDHFGFGIEHLRFAWNTWKFGLWNENEVPDFKNKPNRIISHLDKLWREIESDIVNKKNTTPKPIQSQLILGSKFPKLISYQQKENLLTNSGLIEMAKRGTNEERVPAGTTHCAIGTGTTSPALTDVALETEVDRKEFDTDGDRAVSGKTERYGMAFSYSDVGSVDRDITEAGLFNKSSGGDLIARITSEIIPLTTGRIISVQIDITHQNGVEI